MIRINKTYLSSFLLFAALFLYGVFDARIDVDIKHDLYRFIHSGLLYFLIFLSLLIILLLDCVRKIKLNKRFMIDKKMPRSFLVLAVCTSLILMLFVQSIGMLVVLGILGFTLAFSVNILITDYGKARLDNEHLYYRGQVYKINQIVVLETGEDVAIEVRRKHGLFLIYDVHPIEIACEDLLGLKERRNE